MFNINITNLLVITVSHFSIFIWRKTYHSWPPKSSKYSCPSHINTKVYVTYSMSNTHHQLNRWRPRNCMYEIFILVTAPETFMIKIKKKDTVVANTHNTYVAMVGRYGDIKKCYRWLNHISTRYGYVDGYGNQRLYIVGIAVNFR